MQSTSLAAAPYAGCGRYLYRTLMTETALYAATLDAYYTLHPPCAPDPLFEQQLSALAEHVDLLLKIICNTNNNAAALLKSCLRQAGDNCAPRGSQTSRRILDELMLRHREAIGLLSSPVGDCIELAEGAAAREGIISSHSRLLAILHRYTGYKSRGLQHLKIRRP